MPMMRRIAKRGFNNKFFATRFAIVNVATKQPPSKDDACLGGKGVTFQYDEAAAKKAHEDVMAFLKDVFAQK